MHSRPRKGKILQIVKVTILVVERVAEEVVDQDLEAQLKMQRQSSATGGCKEIVVLVIDAILHMAKQSFALDMIHLTT